MKPILSLIVMSVFLFSSNSYSQNELKIVNTSENQEVTGNLPMVGYGQIYTPDYLTIPDFTPDQQICFALYTVHNNTLKMTAQLNPLKKSGDLLDISLQLKNDTGWVTAAKTKIIYPGWTAHFRVENWDDTKKYNYRVAYQNKAFYEGIIQKNPVNKSEIVIAAFTGNSIRPGDGGDIPKDDIVNNLKKIQPDLLFFSGDQVYDHTRHLEAWLKFGRDFGDIIRDIPTITIPDDHDVGQANLWGNGGKVSNVRTGRDGGYYMPADYVKEVERAQTSHLPDPFDPTPIGQGIGVYYTNLNWGGVSFAILEDRKFKTGPDGFLPPELLKSEDEKINFDPKKLDLPGAELLGERQLLFLKDWAADWENVEMKVALSQTIFAGGAHVHGQWNKRSSFDLDSNGWPQTGRNNALSEIRKAYGFMIAGDQHLATVIHHGIDDWNDAGYSFCVPSIANFFLRWWAPLEEGKNRKPGMPAYLGELQDGLNNKVTMHAVANPSPEENLDKLTTRAAGFGIVKLNKSTREITMECWPRNVDITSKDSKQYEGWPLTINQLDNYGRKPVAFLPTLKINKADQVIQIIDEDTNEIVYTLRIKGNEFNPKVFKKGEYTIHVGEGSSIKTLKGISSINSEAAKSLKIEL